MAKLTSREARMSIYQTLAPLVAELSDRLGYIVPIYWPGLDYAHQPDRTNVYVDVEETTSDKESEGIEAISGSEAFEQLQVSIFLTEAQGELVICQNFADQTVARFSRGREYFDLANDKSVVLRPCVLEPITIRDGRRILPFVITYTYETF